MNSLQALRSKLMEQNNQEQRSTNDNAIYPFWNIPMDTTAVLRFLPDGDSTNTYFWVERNMIRLTFPGVLGGDTHKEVTVQVPCMEMWKETCPILTEVRPWFKDSSLEDLARKYWKKRSYIFQGFVREDPISESDVPENPIRRFVINPSIYKIVHDTLMDPEMEDIPTDYTSGTDFRITKSQQGGYSSYATSSYSRRTSALTEVEKAAIDTYGLFNLSDFLPKKPDDAGVKIIAEMFEASYNGELYNPEKWAEHYRPYGFNYEAKTPMATSNVAQATVNTQASVSTTEAVTVNEPVSQHVPQETVSVEPVAQPQSPAPQPQAGTAGKASPQDILAQIRARKESNS